MGRGPVGHHDGVHQLADLRISPPPDATGFPFDLPAVRTFPGIQFKTPVTLFVGENGSGKSTLLEALAIASRAITVGSAEAADDASLEGVRSLAGAIRLSWTRRSHRGFFLRAEDFFGFAKRMAALRSELEAGLAAVDREYADRPGLAHDLAPDPVPEGARRARASATGPGSTRDRTARLPALLPGAPRPGRAVPPRRAGGTALARSPARVPLAVRTS